MPQYPEPTSGGRKLEMLREQRGLNRFQVEIASGIGVGNLGKYESGERPNPKRDTVDRILDALDARFNERCEVLECFGYTTSTPLPTEEEITWAVASCQPILDAAPFPAYLLDMRDYVHAWNAYIPVMLNLPVEQWRSLTRTLSILELYCDSQTRIIDYIQNKEFVAHNIGMVRSEWELWFAEETWYPQMVERIQQYPELKSYWDREQPFIPNDIDASPLAYLQWNASHCGPMTFRLTMEFMHRDKRFRIVYFMPADKATFAFCEQIQSTPITQTDCRRP